MLEYWNIGTKYAKDLYNKWAFWISYYDKISFPVEKYQVPNTHTQLIEEITSLTKEILYSNSLSSDIGIITLSPLRIIYFLKEVNLNRSHYKEMNDFQYTHIKKVFRKICNVVYTPFFNIINASNNEDLLEFEKLSNEEENDKNEEILKPVNMSDKVINIYLYHQETIKKINKYLYILDFVMILSQTFYGNVNGKRECLMENIKDCKIWNDIFIWELLIIHNILCEKTKVMKTMEEDYLPQDKIENIEQSILITYLFNLDSFGKSDLKETIKNDIFQITYIKSIEEIS